MKIKKSIKNLWFDHHTVRKRVHMQNINTIEKQQSFRKIANERLGETRINNLGSKMWITKYIDSQNVVVKFENGYITKVAYQQFKLGSIKSPYDRSIYAQGYLGQGEYKPYNDDCCGQALL